MGRLDPTLRRDVALALQEDLEERGLQCAVDGAVFGSRQLGSVHEEPEVPEWPV